MIGQKLSKATTAFPAQSHNRLCCWQGEDQGFRVELAHADDEEDSETWEEAMDEMEDPWMREPSGRLNIRWHSRSTMGW